MALAGSSMHTFVEPQDLGKYSHRLVVQDFDLFPLHLSFIALND